MNLHVHPASVCQRRKFFVPSDRNRQPRCLARGGSAGPLVHNRNVRVAHVACDTDELAAVVYFQFDKPNQILFALQKVIVILIRPDQFFHFHFH